jgi:putative DNA primase/helicase
LLFRFTESFLGREDKGLDARLHAELPGILLWAIEGWKRLRVRGHFLQPSSGQDLIDQMKDLSSPVGAFLRERCEVGSGFREEVSAVFTVWKDWCAARNKEPGEEATLGRNLRSVFPHLVTKQARVSGSRERFFEGLRLKSSPVY